MFLIGISSNLSKERRRRTGWEGRRIEPVRRCRTGARWKRTRRSKGVEANAGSALEWYWERETSTQRGRDRVTGWQARGMRRVHPCECRWRYIQCGVGQSVSCSAVVGESLLAALRERTAVPLFSFSLFFLFFFFHSLFPRILPSPFFALSLSFSLSLSQFVRCFDLDLNKRPREIERICFVRRSRSTELSSFRSALRNAPGRARGSLRIRDGEWLFVYLITDRSGASLF